MAQHEHPIFSAFYGFMCARFDETMFGKQRSFLAHNFDDKKVLEIGCGTGASFRYYPSSAKVTAIEPDPHMLRRAQACLEKNPNPNIQVLQADGESLPFQNNEFDAVLSALVFCTIPDAPKALREIGRVLRPGGTLCFLEHVQAPSPFWRGFQSFVNPVWKRISGGCNLTRDTVSLFKEGGFQLETQKVKKRTAPWLPFVFGIARKI